MKIKQEKELFEVHPCKLYRLFEHRIGNGDCILVKGICPCGCIVGFMNEKNILTLPDSRQRDVKLTCTEVVGAKIDHKLG